VTELPPGPHLVFDSSPLNYFARSGQLEVLEKLVGGRRCVITQAVEEELLRGVARHSRLHQVLSEPWLDVDREMSLGQLVLFSEYHSSLGGGGKDIGEATTLAYAEFHGCTAVIDDKPARTRARERQTKHTGTLELLVHGIRQHLLSRSDACRVIDELRDHEAYLPCDGATFLAWGEANGYLDG
jgi:Predicted nucleic acid-binding protein, contains PIN domain